MLISTTYYQYCESKKLQSINQTRAVRVKLQEAEQQQSLLENFNKHLILKVLGEDFSSLQIRMAEHLNLAHGPSHQTRMKSTQYTKTRELQDAEQGQVAQSGIDTKHPGVTGAVSAFRQSLLPDNLQLSADLDIVNAALFKFRTLRIDVQLQVSNAPELLEFLRQLKNAAGGWPGEIRACDIHRSPRPGIDARCIVDIYHWTVLSEASKKNA
jgi:hypothetical protein